ncbi:MAG TPA: AMP-binding protein [bacterium]|nr:AMP-binding protein [bacterium]
MINETFVDVLTRNAEKYPEKKILLSASKNYNYSEIENHSTAIANYLKDLGIKSNDFIGILSLNSPEFIVISFAAWKIGGILTSLNYTLKPEELIYIIQKTKFKCLFLDARFLSNQQLFEILVKTISNIVIIDTVIPKQQLQLAVNSNLYTELIERYNKITFQRINISANHPAVCIFTSGTTGAAKGVLLSHNNLISNIQDMILALKFQSNDIVINVLPMFHIFSFNCAAMLEIYESIPVYIVDKFTPKQTLLAIEKFKITILLAVPVMLKLLIIQQEKEKFNTESLRLVISGGAALDEETFDNFQKIFNLPIYEGFGITETAPVCALNPIGLPPLKKSIGKPLKSVKLRIVDEHGKDCQTNEPGELLIQGPNVMLGYYNDELATNEAIVDGWYKSGDVAVVDDNGNYYIVDRIKDMIIVNGLNVYPAEIEKHINSFDGIIESAVVGYNDRRHGEKIIAFVVVDETTEFDKLKLLKYLKEKLANYKVPDKIIKIAELPKSAIGKILKKELRAKMLEYLKEP